MGANSFGDVLKRFCGGVRGLCWPVLYDRYQTLSVRFTIGIHLHAGLDA